MITQLEFGVRKNSLTAFQSERRKLSKRAALILEDLRVNGAATDRKVCQRMGFGNDLNMVRPRITGLIQDGHAHVVDNVPCEVTGQTVRRVAWRMS